MRGTIFVSPELGAMIQQKRKELGIRQEDVALTSQEEANPECHMSTATVSNIERGACQVGKAKLEFFCNYIGFDLDNVADSLFKNPTPTEGDLKLKLMAIENKLSLVDADEAWNELRQIQLEKDHPYQAWVDYLTGKYYQFKEKWTQAQVHYTKAIHRFETQSDPDENNLCATCYHELSYVHYRLNELNQALTYIQKGLDVFDPQQDRNHIYSYLLIHQVICLEKLNRDTEALKILESMWSKRHTIESSKVRLNLYQMRAKLLNKLKQYEAAIPFAFQGLEKARIEQNHNLSMELWITLGESYLHLGKITAAERCLQAALDLKDKISKKYLIASSYTQLGLLYLIQKKYPAAASVLTKAISVSKEINDAFQQMNALIALGECNEKQKQYQLAKQNFEQALQLAKKHGSVLQQWDITMRLAGCCKRFDPNSYQKYVDQFFELNHQLTKGGKNMTQIEILSKLKYAGDPPNDG